jgi:hypothetical protein
MGDGPGIERGTVMPIVFNLVGLLFLLVAFAAGFSTQEILGKTEDLVFGMPVSRVLMLVVFGAVAFTLDVVYRVRRDRTGGLGRFFDLEGGGQLMILPVWLWGVAAIGYGGYHVVREAWVSVYDSRVLDSEKPWVESADQLEFSSDGQALARWNTHQPPPLPPPELPPPPPPPPPLLPPELSEGAATPAATVPTAAAQEPVAPAPPNAPPPPVQGRLEPPPLPPDEPEPKSVEVVLEEPVAP